MKIRSLNIEQFREFKNINLNLGEYLTVISGCNGTGKTSILGLIGHIFTYKNKNSLCSLPFKTEFSDIFRFSETYDTHNIHRYSLIFEDKSEKKAVSRIATEKNKTRLRIDVGNRVKSKGKIEIPVIYFGLKRLIPLAQENENFIQFNSENVLSDQEKKQFMQFYNRIFATDLNIQPQHIKTKNKNQYLPITEKYDANGVSAGQDNIGQIILGLLSFQRLKESNKDYIGAILLIDEIDATLHPASQKNLIRVLFEEAKRLNIQICFTTHSSDILRYIFSREASSLKHSTKLIYIDNANGDLKISQDDLDLQIILSDLNHEVYTNTATKKVNIYFEDSEAIIFFKNLISGTSIGKKIEIKNVKLGFGNYIHLINANFPEFKKSIVVLDGDCTKEVKKKQRVIFLPGKDRPENIIYNFLCKLDKSDNFWSSELAGYTQKIFLQNKPLDQDVSNRITMKKWFNDNKKYWGKNCSKIMKIWKKNNKKDVDKFISSIDQKIDTILTSNF